MKKKSRIQTVNLSKIAHEVKLAVDRAKRKINVEAQYGWFSKYVSDCLIRDFGQGQIAENVLRCMIVENSKAITDLQKANRLYSEQLGEVIRVATIRKDQVTKMIRGD